MLILVGGDLFYSLPLPLPFAPYPLPTVFMQDFTGHTNDCVNGRLVLGTSARSKAFILVHLAGALVGAEGRRQGRRVSGIGVERKRGEGKLHTGDGRKALDPPCGASV